MASKTLTGLMATGFFQRYQTLEKQHREEEGLISELLVYTSNVEKALKIQNESLEKHLSDATLDLEDARRSRRDMQSQLLLLNKELLEARADLARNPYIQVLIDGDGMIFNSDLIRQGVEGGKQAAALLRNKVLELCPSSDIEIIANVYTNLHGLSSALLRDGSTDDMEQFKNFTVGFTQGKASFNFIDVGHGKERADSKIKEVARWHLRHQNCKQILLGISHDAGYAPFLDEVIKDERHRVSIIEGPPIVRELTALGLQTYKFEAIFRPTKLIDRITNKSSTTAGSSNTAPTSWAGVTSIAPTAAALPILVKNGVPSKPVPTPAAKPKWQPGPRGYDPVINVKTEVLEAIKRRTNSNKLCNNHYLRGPCAKGDDCVFEHKYKATEEDMKAIAFLTRLNPCTSGQDCALEYCIYGHHCPSVKYTGANFTGPVCNAFGCRFSASDHPDGTVIKQPRREIWGTSNYY